MRTGGHLLEALRAHRSAVAASLPGWSESELASALALLTDTTNSVARIRKRLRQYEQSPQTVDSPHTPDLAVVWASPLVIQGPAGVSLYLSWTGHVSVTWSWTHSARPTWA